MIRYLGFLTVAFAAAASASAQSSSQAASGVVRPAVAISVEGPDVIFTLARLHYRLTTEAGSYVSVFLISSTGRVSLLNPSEAALRRSSNSGAVRETSVGFESGQWYVVAVATVTPAHSSKLVRRTGSAVRLAGFSSADASLNQLITRTLPASGDDFSYAYASFEVVSRRLPSTFAYMRGCSTSAGFASDSFYYFSEGFYGGDFLRAGRIDRVGPPEYLPPDGGNFGMVCPSPLTPRLPVVAILPAPTPSPVPHDTSSTRGDSASGGIAPPVGPGAHPHSPWKPLDLPPEVDGERRVTPVIRLDPVPGVPVERAALTPQDFQRPEVPIAQPIPVSPVRPDPIERDLPPRADPIPVQREVPEPVSQRPMPIERSREPVQPRLQPIEPPVQPVFQPIVHNTSPTSSPTSQPGDPVAVPPPLK